MSRISFSADGLTFEKNILTSRDFIKCFGWAFWTFNWGYFGVNPTAISSNYDYTFTSLSSGFPI